MTVLHRVLQGLYSGQGRASHAAAANRKPHLFVTMFLIWGLLLVWFHPRLVSILEGASTVGEWLSLGYFVVFVEIAWLYGAYNICIVLFARIDRYLSRNDEPVTVADASMPEQAVAVLYTTCNDFVEESALSCVNLEYRNFKLYILDDSSDKDFKARIDRFAARYGDLVQVIRRADRRGFKAGNLNHALSRYVSEPLFAIVDADEILPRDFLTRMTARLLADPNCGFVQANHICNKRGGNKLKQDMSIGVDIHWKWYQPLRNRFGFVMFLGHGALLRTSCWKQVNGFPELVSEDLAFAIAIREHGYYGTFAEEVVCMEDFPQSVRAFRVRHIKWTRGTCEFLGSCMSWLVRSKNISLVEKLDILFPTLNLPMTFFFFIFMINSSLIIPLMMGEKRDITFVLAGQEFVLPMLMLPDIYTKLYSADFFAITVLTILAPILCFILELYRYPVRLFRFLCHSTSLYAALSPMTTIAVFGYAVTRKARFLVTGDESGGNDIKPGRLGGGAVGARLKQFFSETHPDHRGMQYLEFAAGLVFLVTALITFQIAFIGLAIGFMMMPVMHNIGWDNALTRVVVWLPFSFIVVGIGFGGLSIFGMYPVLFGYGFHF